MMPATTAAAAAANSSGGSCPVNTAAATRPSTAPATEPAIPVSAPSVITRRCSVGSGQPNARIVASSGARSVMLITTASATASTPSVTVAATAT